MTSIRRKAIVALVLMIAAIVAAHAMRATERFADQHEKLTLESVFPSRFGRWSVDTRLPPQLVSPDVQYFLDKIYNQTLSRVYVDESGHRVMLSVAYGGDQSDATRAHRPEVCYPAQGFEIVSGDVSMLNLGPKELRVKKLVARQGGRWEPITYWITVGEKVALSGPEQKLAQLSYTLRGVVPDGMLVRVSTIDANTVAAFDIQADFLRAMVGAIPENFRVRIAGR